MEEAHPIPQNVTAFQFHLIGDMTIRQFIYLAVGLVIGYLTFMLVYPVAPVVAVPVILVSVLLGVSFAFVPVLDRPLDHWVKAYFKAVYSATQARWKSPVYPPDETLFYNRLNIFLSSTPISTSSSIFSAVAKTSPADHTDTKNSAPAPTQTASPTALPTTPQPEPDNSSPAPTTEPPKPQHPHKSEHHKEGENHGLDFSPDHNLPLSEMQFVFDHPSARKNTHLPTPSLASSIPQPSNPPITAPVPAASAQPAVTTSVMPPAPPTQPATTPPPKATLQPITENPTQLSQDILKQSNEVMQSLSALTQDQSQIQNQIQSQSSPADSAPSTPLPSSDDLNKLVELAKQARTLQVKLSEAEKQINALTTSATAPEASSEEHKSQFQQIFGNLQTLINQADILTQQATTANKSLNTKKKEVVKVVEPPKPQTTQVLLTSQPNVINGIVKDEKGTYLENVIIIIHDKDQLPVRALKTNKLGQFTGTTPLPAGVYTITLEKEGLEFDTLQVTLAGEVMPPLEVTAKEKKEQP